jgi:hypothetical protein
MTTIDAKPVLQFLIMALGSWFLIQNTCHAQDNTNYGMWNTFSIEKELSKKASLFLDEELRLKDSYSRLNLLYTNLGVSYKPLKGLKVSLIYRCIEKYKKSDEFSFRHRLMLDVGYKYRLSNWTFAYRSRFQSEVRDYLSDDDGKTPEWFWRNKVEVKYTFLKKYSPYLGTELRYQIKDPRNPAYDEGWHRIRMFGGLDYSINANNSIGIYYLVQQEFNVESSQQLQILGLQYSLTLPDRKSKKENDK